MGMFKTTLCFSVAGCADYEVEAVVEYRRSAGWVSSSFDPGEMESFDIEDIKVCGETIPDWMFNQLADNTELLALAQEDFRDAAQYAAEMWAEAQREMREGL